jgi:hypothetical protein
MLPRKERGKRKARMRDEGKIESWELGAESRKSRDEG